MAGYTRQDTSNNIANGNVVNADDLDSEFNAIEGAFNSASGHTHDGSAGNGVPISKVGPGQEITVSTSAVTPKLTNSIDLGTEGIRYKDGYFAGEVEAQLGFTGNLTGNVTGNVTGNASTATAWQTGRSITLSGDVSGTVANVNGTANVVINTTVADNSHNHTTSTITDFVESTQDLVGGMITGNTENGISVVYDDAAGKINFDVNDPIITLSGDVVGSGTITNLGNVTISTTIEATTLPAGSVVLGSTTTGDYVQTITGGTGVTVTGATGEGSSPSVSIGQNVATTSNVTFNQITTTGNAIINGNLTVSGTTTTVNTETVNLADNIITLNSNETGTPTQNAGIEVERGTSINKTLVWDEATDRWTVGSETFAASNFVGNLTGDVTGNSSTATKLATARSITLAGDVSGSTSFDGTGNVTITATVADDSHTHTIANVDGLQASLDSKAPTAGSPTQAFSASTLNASTVDLGNWTITENTGILYFATNGVNKMKLDASGNLTVVGNVTAFGTV
jgi:hypothetical protein